MRLFDPKIDGPVLYRYSDSYQQSPTHPHLDYFKIVRETEKSYLIDDLGDEKWVRKEGTNIFAWDTKEKAIYNYLMRKRKQIKIYESRILRAKQFRRIAAVMIDPETKEGSKDSLLTLRR